MTWLAGVDVGGTFTDVVLINTRTGEIRLRKVPTTVRNQAESFLRGLKEAAPLAEVDAIVHGTTVGTNALLERKGARTGLITSQGFRDVLELGRRTRPRDYGMTGQFEPLVPREHRLEVPERVDAHGSELVPLDVEALERAVQRLLDLDVESVAIMFMHSYAKHEHELTAEEVVRSLWPNDYVSVSHKVLPEVGEFERVTTTAINAYLQPLLHRYVTRVDDELRREGYGRSFRIMQSNGGALNVLNAARNACRSVLSGPAGGAIAAGWIGRQIGAGHVISADMGGTSFDVALILDGEPALSEEKEFTYGIPSRIPMIDIETIGAGGGSLVYVDEVGILHVGPESAGAEPGPISYGRGGARPTVTDANVLLGRLDITNVMPEAGDRIPAVREAFAQVGAVLGTNPEGAAEAALSVIDLNMAGAIRKITLEKGLDTRKFVLIPFGGAGPLHACSLADKLMIPRVLVPVWPGVTSALGCLLADIRYDDTWTVHLRLDQVQSDHVEALFSRMVERIMEVMHQDGVPETDVQLRYEAALQYEGQSHRVIVQLPSSRTDADELATLFAREYRDRYSVTVEDVPIRLVNLRVRATASRRVAEAVGARLTPSSTPRRERRMLTGRMMFAGAWYDSELWQRAALDPSCTVTGPARIDQADTTTIVPPGWTARIDAFGNLMITREAAR